MLLTQLLQSPLSLTIKSCLRLRLVFVRRLILEKVPCFSLISKFLDSGAGMPEGLAALPTPSLSHKDSNLLLHEEIERIVQVVPIKAEHHAALRVVLFPSSVTELIDALQRSPKPETFGTPFHSDSQYLQFVDRRFYLLSYYNLAANSSFSGTVVKLIEVCGLSTTAVAPIISNIITLFDRYIKARSSAMPEPPRVLRVAKKLRLSGPETDAILYILSQQCGSSPPFGHTTANALLPATVARFARLDAHQLMHFLSDSRAHIKQGLIGMTEQRLKGLLLESRLTMSMEAVAAFSGVNLTEEQIIKLDKTCLCEVLLEEGTHERPSGRGGSAGSYTEGSGSDDEEGSEADDGDSPKHVGRKRPRDSSVDDIADDPRHPRTSDLSPPLHPQPTNGTKDPNASTSKLHQPYTSDVEYADDVFKLLAAKIKLRYAEGDIKDEEDAAWNPKNKAEASVREFTGRTRLMAATIASRLEATAKSKDKFYPKMAKLTDELHLNQFEKDLLMLLVGNVISHDILIAINGRHVMRGEGQRELTVGFVLFVLCDGLPERVAARGAFSHQAPLIDRGLVSITIGSPGRTSFNTDLMDYLVDIDRKIVDLIVGLDTQTSELVQNSRLYTPNVNCASVVLPEETKEKVMSTVEHYELFSKCKKRCGFGEGLMANTGGLVFLFHGPSGTGKTMLANGVANELKKKVLLVTLAQFKNDSKAPDILRFVFREAKLNDAIIFFDECESFFENRESNPLVTSVLAQFERYEGLIIMATNRAQVIDEAMNRRISLMVEFKLPDHNMREEIWRAHLPPAIKLGEDVDLMAMALNYELSGGLIKNAALAALSLAVARDKSDDPVVMQEDLVAGAKMQLRGFFQTADPSSSKLQYITPKRSLRDMILEKTAKDELEAVVKATKTRATLFSQWGFEESECCDEGMLCLFSGLSGTGKSFAAEAIAMECGATIRCTNVSEMLMKRELQIETIFEEGRKLGAIIVFDSAQALFDHSDRGEQVSELIQYHANGYPRPVIVIATTQPGHAGGIDCSSSKLRFAFEINFQLPGRTLRELLWRRSLPRKVPLADDVDFKALSEKACSAKFIRTAAFNACARVSLLPLEQRKVTMKHLTSEFEALSLKNDRRNKHFRMYV